MGKRRIKKSKKIERRKFEPINVDENNMRIHLGTPELINENIRKSNPEYDKGYIPYFARRRMDLCEGEPREIVNDVAVALEFARLNQYGNRSCASRAHIHDLIEYMKMKKTLFVPWLNYDPDKVIKKGPKYRQANMAWQILKKYIYEIICKRVKFMAPIGDVKNTAYSLDFVSRNIENFIYKQDLVDFIMTAFKVGHERDVAEIMATIIWGIRGKVDDKEALFKFLHKEIVERMVVYIYVGSKPDELEPWLNQCIHSRFPEMIVKVAAGFQQHEASMINMAYIGTQDLKEYGYRIINNGYQILERGYYGLRFESAAEFSEFYNEIIADPKTDKAILENLSFQISLADQDGIEKLVPETINGQTEFDINTDFGPEYSFLTFGLWLYCHPHHINTKEFKREWITPENKEFIKLTSLAMMKILYDCKNFPGNKAHPAVQEIQRFMDSNVDLFARIANEEVEELLRKKKDKKSINNLFYATAIKPFVLSINEPINGINCWNVEIYVREMMKYPNFWKYIVTAVPNYNKYLLNTYNSHIFKIRFRKSDIEKFISDEDITLSDVMKCVYIDLNFEWLKDNYGKYFVEIPESCFMIPDMDIGEEKLNWCKEVLTEDQLKSYPFPVATMKAHREFFEPLIDECNIDRYTKAYGLNWVEDHHSISITDLVNSKSYVNHTLIRRYLDIILMDKELRDKFLDNEAVCKALVYREHVRTDNPHKNQGHVLKTLLMEILDSSNFTNEIKCEVIMRIFIKVKFAVEAATIDFKKYIPGSGNTGRAMLGVAYSCTNEKRFLECITDNIFDIPIEEKKDELEEGE